MQWENDFSLKLRIKTTKVTKEHLKKEKLQKIKKGKLFRTVSFYYLLKNLKNNIAFVTLWFKIKPMKPHVSARFINSVNCILIITLSNYHINKFFEFVSRIFVFHKIFAHQESIKSFFFQKFKIFYVINSTFCDR